MKTLNWYSLKLDILKSHIHVREDTLQHLKIIVGVAGEYKTNAHIIEYGCG